MEMTKRTIGRIVISGLTIVSAVVAFYCVDRAIVIEEASKFVVPLIALSTLMLLYFLHVITVKNVYMHAGVVALMLITSFLFVQTAWHVFFVVTALCLILIGSFEVRRDIRSSMKINMARSISAGIVYLVIALSLVIASHYYVSIKDFEKEKLVVLLTQSSLLERTVDTLIDRMIPSDEADTPLLPGELRQQEAGDVPSAALPDLTPDQIAILKKAGVSPQSIAEGLQGVVVTPSVEKQITEMYNLPPSFMERFGDELLQGATLRDVMPKVIMLQIEESILKKNAFVWNNIAKVIALILFLSVFTIGFVWRFILTPVIILAFYGIMAVGIVSRTKETREVEVLR